MLAALSPLFSACLVVLSCLALGTALLRRLGIILTRAENRVFAFLTGAACVSLLILGLATLQLIYKPVFYTLTATLLWIAWGRKRETEYETPRPVPRLPIKLSLCVVLPFLVLYFFNAWAPEYSPDGSTYHLGYVLLFARHHGLIPIRTLYGALPEGLEMLFLFAFTLGRHSAAALVHFSFLLALPFLMFSYARRFGFPRAGVLAAVMVFLSPLFGQDGVSAYNDVALAAVTFGVFYLMELWLETNQDRLLIPAGILAGFAFGIKYTGFIAALYAVAPLAIRMWRRRRVLWQPIVMFSAACLVFVIPWLVKNAVYMHNPVAPFLNSVFPNPWVSPRFEQLYRQNMATYAGTNNLVVLFLSFTVTGAKVIGFFGPLFVLAPLGLLSLRTRQGRHLLLAAVVFGLPILSNQGSRFLMASLPPLALALALAVANTQFVVPTLIVLQALTCWPDVTAMYADQYTWRLTSKIPFAAAWHRRRTDGYLHDRIGPTYDIGKIIDAQTPPGSKIYCRACPPEAYTAREALPTYETLLGNLMEDMVFTPNEPNRKPTKVITLGFPRITAYRLRISNPHPRADEVWQINELRILNAGIEIPRAPDWRIDAAPDPWEAPLAFDNNLASRWSTEQFGAAGAYIEIVFRQPTTLDEVTLQSSSDQTAQLTIQAGAQPDKMVQLNPSIRSSVVPVPVGLRRAATLMLKTYGYNYLIAADGDYFTNDYAANAAYWGIRPVASTGGLTLYRLE